MGWVVYTEQHGQIIKYYKTSAPAKRLVTQHNRLVDRRGFSWPKGKVACCPFPQFEGVLLGLRGEELKMWQFFNSKGIPT